MLFCLPVPNSQVSPNRASRVNCVSGKTELCGKRLWNYQFREKRLQSGARFSFFFCFFHHAVNPTVFLLKEMPSLSTGKTPPCSFVLLKMLPFWGVSQRPSQKNLSNLVLRFPAIFPRLFDWPGVVEIQSCKGMDLFFSEIQIYWNRESKECCI